MATSISSTTNSSASGSLSSAGIGSGLDVNTIVSQLMAVESRPLTQLQSAASTINTTLTEMGKLQSYFSALRDKAQALNAVNLWNGTTATSADTTSVGVSTNSTTPATAGSYAVAVSKLATGQTVSSTSLAASTTAVGTGTLTIELGTYGTGTPAGSFSAKADATPVTINITDGDNTLAGIRDKINSAGAGVTASLITDASGVRLSLRSTATGAENGFRITASETADDGNAATGLSMLAFDGTQSGSPMTQSTSASNAEATVNGIAISSASNTLSNVVDGLTLTLNKTTTAGADINITVAADTASVKTAVTNFVSAFNTLASFIRTDTAYNADNKTGGPLQGDQATLALQSQLRNVLNQSSSASSSWSALSQVGIAIKSDGTLETNATKLDSALGNLPELKKLFSASGSTLAETGFIRRFQDLADAALSTGGGIDSRTTGLRANLDRNSKSQDALNIRLTNTEARLRKQYQALDTKMASLTSLSNYMTQQITKMNASG